MKHILTFADSKFFPIVVRLVKNTRRFVGYQLFIYDLGLTDPQKKALTEAGAFILQTAFPRGALEMNTRGQIRAAHKMYCIENFVQFYGKPVVVLDADTLIIERIDELWPAEPDSIVVTARCPREHAPHQFANGAINSGVMAFGSGVPASFFLQWKERCLRDPGATDQSALSDMLTETGIDFGKLDIRQRSLWGGVVVRDGEVYNDVTCRTGKIFHFKSIARRTKKLLTYKLFAAIHGMLPLLFERFVRYNRKHRIYVWRKRNV